MKFLFLILNFEFFFGFLKTFLFNFERLNFFLFFFGKLKENNSQAQTLLNFF